MAKKNKGTKTFRGRAITPGECTAEAVVSHGGDQNNPDLYKKILQGKALCLPQTIGSTTGGMFLYCAVKQGKNPACLLFSKEIDSLAAAGAVLSEVWAPESPMPVVDNLGDEFLDYVQDGDTITVHPDGSVDVAR